MSDRHDSSSGPHRAIRVVEELRRMILGGELLPGQQIRQEYMAERLGVSRLPVRESLRQLTSEGLVCHTPNVGYTVARFSRSEFDQIYLMRSLIETEVLRSISIPTEDQLSDLMKLNDAVTDAANRADLTAMRELNQMFHFAVFRLSEYTLMVSELERLWNWAGPYHSMYLVSSESRQTVLEEHAAMVEALRQGNLDDLVSLMDQHRHGSETQLSLMFGSSGPMPRSIN